MVKSEFNILIADRNPHIRELLKREFIAGGYHVRLVKSGKEILKYVYSNDPLDIIILDLNLPDENETFILEKLHDRIPEIPIIIHSFMSDYIEHPAVLNAAAFVEKRGNSIESLKQVTAKILQEKLKRQNRLIDNNKDKTEL